MSFSNEQQGGTQHSDSFARLTIGESGGPERNLMKGPGSSVSSAESMRSNKSRDGPPNLTGERRNLMKGSGSSVSSAESMRSDKSRDGPPNLTGERSLKSMSSGYASSVSASSVSSGREQCDACTKTAVKRCLTCDSYFCITHVDDHYKTPELQKHDLQDLQYHSLCEQHHRELELYCTTDQSPICLQCLLHNHRGHEVIEQSPRRTKEGVSPSVPSPGPIQFPSVQSESVSLSWSPPEGAPNYNTFRVTWSGGRKQHSITVEGLDLEVTELIPGEKYNFAVSTLSDDDSQSPCVVRSVHTEVPPPVNLSVDLKLLSASLAWTKPAGVDQVSYLLVLLRDQKRIATIHRNSPHYTITEIKHGEDYTVSVSTVLVNSRQSKPTSTIFRPEIPFPEDLAVSSITRSSAFLCWLVSAEMQQAPHSFLVSYQSKGTEPQSIYTESCSTDITGLKAGTEYTVRVYTVLQNGERSQPASLQMRTDSLVYIAIDFGTAYSEYSFHVDDSDYKCYSWGVEYGIRSCKTPTCILFDKRKNFKSFGYAAMKEYSKKVASKSTYFFENFKMTFYKNHDIHSDFELTATNGEKMSALKVFSESLRFLKDRALETILNYSEMITVPDVTWILTVPAIWNNAAKDFMRRAAMQAGLVDDSEPDKLMFATELEAALVYCKNLPDLKFPGDQPKFKLDESPGMQYIVAHCGGWTIDVAVYELLDKGQLKEVYVASGNGLGGQNVDMKLTSFLQEICGDDCWEEYRKQHKNDLHHTLVKFDVSKCYEDNEGYSFICSHTLVELIKKHRKQDIASILHDIEGATWDEDDSVIEISHTKFRSFFEESLRGIHTILDDIIKKPELHIRYLILVGEFSSSKILQNYIEDKFGSRCTVICPLLPQEAVVSGALLFARNPGVIASRI